MRARLAVAVAVVLLAAGCAAKTYHIGAVSTLSAHSALKLAFDTEVKLVCDREGAPPAGQCVPLETHHKIASLFSQAFKLDEDVLTVMRTVEPDAPLPSQVPTLLGSISKLLADIFALIPESPKKTALTQRIEGR